MKTGYIGLRLDQHLVDKIRAAAKQSGQSASAWIRDRCLAAVGDKLAESASVNEKGE